MLNPISDDKLYALAIKRLKQFLSKDAIETLKEQGQRDCAMDYREYLFWLTLSSEYQVKKFYNRIRNP